MKLFEEDFRSWRPVNVRNSLAFTAGSPEDDEVELIHDALVLGIRDYFEKTGLKSAVLGLSGGIDSAVTLVLATQALGAANMRVLLMPSQYSSEHSVTDAARLARNLGVHYEIIDIREIFFEYHAITRIQYLKTCRLT